MVDERGDAARFTYVLTFTDLVYATLTAFALTLINSSLTEKRYWSVALLVAAIVLMFYDWYANHYFAIEQHLGIKNIPLDVFSFFQYTGLLYYSSRQSLLLLIFLAVRGARGIFYNELALRQVKGGPRDAARLRSYNYSSGFMVILYTALFAWDSFKGIRSATILLATVVTVWLIAYGISMLAEKRLKKRFATGKIPSASRDDESTAPGEAPPSSSDPEGLRNEFLARQSRNEPRDRLAALFRAIWRHWS